MSEPPKDTEPIEIVLGNLLRFGTVISASVIALAGAAYLWSAGGDTPDYGAFRGESAKLRSVADIVADAARFNTRGMIQLGILLLVATPIARVIGALVAFAMRRDVTYVVVSALVLAGLLYSLLAS
jgi:uncharacterized membrane protein